MLANLDVVRLRIFREVVAGGSFTAAAGALGITQPAVSQQIAKLEQEIGAPLLDRSGRGVRLTRPGQVLLGHTERILDQLTQAGRELAAAIEHGGEELRMVAFPSAAATVVPPVVAAFRRAAPQVPVRLSEADPPVSLPRLAAGEYDLALGYDYPCLAAERDPALRYETIADDRMALAVPADHPLAADPAPLTPVDLATLRDQLWVTPHHCVCREALVLACRIAGFTPTVVSETNDYMAMLGLVAAGVGVAVVPRLVAAITVHPGARLRPITGTVLARRMLVVTRAEGYRPAAVDQMCQLLRGTLGTLAHPDFPFDQPRTE